VHSEVFVNCLDPSFFLAEACGKPYDIVECLETCRPHFRIRIEGTPFFDQLPSPTSPMPKLGKVARSIDLYTGQQTDRFDEPLERFRRDHLQQIVIGRGVVRRKTGNEADSPRQDLKGFYSPHPIQLLLVRHREHRGRREFSLSRGKHTP